MKLIRIQRYLVYRAPKEYSEIVANSNNFIIKQISLKDIERDGWLRKRYKDFNGMLEDGHIGLMGINKDTSDVTCYGWIAMNATAPSHIPFISEGVAWLHYQRVKDEYQGYGLQKTIILESLRLLLDNKRITNIYIDTRESNLASRTNILKLGFKEEGIYTVVSLGTKKIPYCYLQFGRFNKKKKHPLFSKAIKSKSKGGLDD